MRLLMIPATRIIAGILFSLVVWFCIAGSARADEAFDHCVDIYKVGTAAYHSKDYQTAIDEYTEARDCLLELSGRAETESTADLLNNIGMAYHSLGDYDRALENYQKALKIRLKVLGLEHPDTAMSYNNIGMVYDSLGDYERALEFYNKALEIRLNIFGPEHPHTAQSYTSVGGVYESFGYYESALKYYFKALEIYQIAYGEENLDTAISYNNIGLAYYRYGYYQSAIEYYNKALMIYSKTPDQASEYIATGYNNIGLVYYSLGDYERALDWYNKSLEIRLNIFGPEHPHTAQSYNNIGLAYSFLGDYESALDWYNKSLEIRLNIFGPEHPDTAISYNNIGLAYTYAGDYNRALECYKKSLEIRLNIFGPEHLDVAQSYNNIGLAFSYLGNYELALEYFNKAQEIKLSILGQQHPDNTTGYNNIGEVYFLLGDYERALENYTKALSSDCGSAEKPVAWDCRPETGTVNAFMFIAQVHLKRGQHANAIDAYENAATALERLRGNIQSAESKTFHGGQYYDMFPEGIGAFVSLHNETGDVSALERGFMFAERGIGRVFLEQLGRSRAMVDGGLSEDEIQLGRTLEAQRKAALDNLDRILSIPKEQQSQSARTQAYDALKAAQDALDDYDARMRLNHPEYAALMNPQPRPLSDIRDVVLAPGEAALEYYVGAEYSWLIFITKDKIRIIKLNLPPDEPPDGDAEQPSIKSVVGKFRYNLRETDYYDPDEGVNLYDLLIAPVESDLAGITKLLIVPTGNLNLLPFETLYDGKQYLVQRFNIRYAPSLNVAYMAADRAMRSERNWDAGRQWVGFGDPIYGGAEDDRVEIRPDGTVVARGTVGELRGSADDLLQRYGTSQSDEIECHVCGKQEYMRYKAPLPLCRLCNTKEEVGSIAAQFGYATESINVHLGLDVNEPSLREAATEGYRFIHVSTHGTMGLDKDKCLPPALFLSTLSTMNKARTESRSLCFDEPDPDDGVLTMVEVFNMKAPAEMVVLSACETGRGQMERGEGVAGMSRAFLYAGADSLVVSLWSVADEQTKDLMVSFYKKILSGQDRQSALTATKREFIDAGLAPYYWAPFIYIGVN